MFVVHHQLLLVGTPVGILDGCGGGGLPTGSGVRPEFGNVVGPLFDGHEYPDVQADHAGGGDVKVDDGRHSLEGHVGSELRVTHRV